MSVIIGVRVVVAQVAGKPKLTPMASYRDPAEEISFRYPAVWNVDATYRFYMVPRILQGDLKPQVQVSFLPAGNVYAKTNLTALVFVYAKSSRTSAESCTALAVGTDTPKTQKVLIDGVAFQHFDTGDAGMCHRADQHVYWTYRNGSCYLFEGDMQTICPGVEEGHRGLTDAEQRALTRHLQAIPQSIRFGNSSAP